MKYQNIFGSLLFSVAAVLTLSQITLVNAQEGVSSKQPITGPITGPVVLGQPSPCNNVGDIDSDGLVTLGDAEIALKIVAQIDPYKNPTREQIRRADVDANKRVSSVDALKIKRYVMYLDNTFAACTTAIKK